MSSKIIFILILLSIFTRFYGLSWDGGYFSHPDENNMATALSQLSSTNLNPHFFAYGQFPLYLGYFTLKLINVPNTFPNSIYILRFYSAIFSLLFLYYSYLLSCELFKSTSSKFAGSIFPEFPCPPLEGTAAFDWRKNISKNLNEKSSENLPALLFIFLLIFSPGLIQIAHFGTTESLLSFVFIANLYYLLKIYDNPAAAGPKFIYFVIPAILSGVALGSKITAIFFIWPIILIGLFKKQYLSTLFFILVTSFLLLVTSPYNFIDINNFLSSMHYETGVATGAIEVFYTRQFFNTVPYLFQFINIFPYVVGLPTFIISLLGLYFFIKNYSKKYIFWLLILLPITCYFLYFGQLFVKWTRFMSPIFFIFPLFATIYISKLKLSSFQPARRGGLLITIFCVLPGILFFSQYLFQNPRVQASSWINQNIPSNSVILSESGNVTDLKLRPDINIINFDFYSLDNNYENKINLDNLLSKSDYVLIPSRRIIKNQNNPMFPYSQSYYQNIFSKNYKLIYQSMGGSENAEETYTVFDFPTLRLYKSNDLQD